MKKSVIFDMDGVVVDTEPLSHRANMKFYQSLGINVTDDVYSTFIGNSDKNIIQKVKDIYKDENFKNHIVLYKDETRSIKPYLYYPDFNGNFLIKNN